MEIGLGQLTFLTDGIDYACIWSPSGEDHTSENARALSLIAIALVKDQTDYLAWQKNINDRWLDACARILNESREHMHIDEVKVRDVN